MTGTLANPQTQLGSAIDSYASGTIIDRTFLGKWSRGMPELELVMTDVPHWQITGDWFDNCSCAVACPCTFAQAPDNGVCESVLFWHIRRGHYGNINLDGLSFVRVGTWEGDLWAGKAKGTAGIFIDERANDQQAEVLPRIFGGHAGGFPALVAALFAEGRQVRGVERARITFDIAPDRS